jgi:toxin HigB-1
VDIFEVGITERAKEQLISVPLHIAFKLQSWISGVQIHGLREMKKVSGYHDEPLKGKRKGQRSIRLNKAYRAFYVINKNGMIEFIEVIEVNKHEY